LNKLDQHFSSLLTFLCPDDPDEAGHRYLRLHQKLEGYFRTRGSGDPTAAADEALSRLAPEEKKSSAPPSKASSCATMLADGPQPIGAAERMYGVAFDAVLGGLHHDYRLEKEPA